MIQILITPNNGTTRVKVSICTLTPYALLLRLAFLYTSFSPTGNVAHFKISAINKKKCLGRTLILQSILKNPNSPIFKKVPSVRVLTHLGICPFLLIIANFILILPFSS